MASLNYPKNVVLGDITLRDGLQREEKFVPTDAKLWLCEQLVLAGFKRIEVTNLGNPKGMPQFKDADELMKRMRESRKIKPLLGNVETTAVTIREKAADRAIQARKEGYGPGRPPAKGPSYRPFSFDPGVGSCRCPRSPSGRDHPL